MLVCCPSNVAVDNIVELLRVKLDWLTVCRVGVAGKMSAVAKEVSLDALANERRNAKEEVKAGRARRGGNDLEIQEVGRVLDGVDVVLTTNAGAGDYKILKYFASRGKSQFVVVIDEAAQCTEPLTWIPIRLGRKVVLAGDHKQLQPTVISEEARREGLAVSMFERLVKSSEMHSAVPNCFLQTQYRMAPVIMQWSSQEFYKGKLLAANSVKDIAIAKSLRGQLKEIGQEALKMITSKEVVMIDTADCNTAEMTTGLDKSKYNLQ